MLKEKIVAEIDRIAEDRLTAAQREEIADRAIKIIEDYNKTIAVAAMETVRQASKKSAGLEPDHGDRKPAGP
jgi:hypothetical protein